MATTFKPSYSGAASAVTITLASLANAAYRQALGVDNGTNLYADVLLTGKLKSGASGTAVTGSCTLFAAAYDGTQYSNNASGSDAAFTVDNVANLTPIYTLTMIANATTYYLPPIYVAQAAGWLALPQKWALILLNGTGGSLDSTGANHVIEYQGINWQGV